MVSKNNYIHHSTLHRGIHQNNTHRSVIIVQSHYSQASEGGGGIIYNMDVSDVECLSIVCIRIAQ